MYRGGNCSVTIASVIDFFQRVLLEERIINGTKMHIGRLARGTAADGKKRIGYNSIRSYANSLALLEESQLTNLYTSSVTPTSAKRRSFRITKAWDDFTKYLVTCERAEGSRQIQRDSIMKDVNADDYPLKFMKSAYGMRKMTIEGALCTITSFLEGYHLCLRPEGQAQLRISDADIFPVSSSEKYEEEYVEEAHLVYIRFVVRDKNFCNTRNPSWNLPSKSMMPAKEELLDLCTAIGLVYFFR